MEYRDLLACLSVCHSREPCKNCWTDRDTVWDWTQLDQKNNVENAFKVSEWVSSFLTAHQHIIGHSVP